MNPIQLQAIDLYGIIQKIIDFYARIKYYFYCIKQLFSYKKSTYSILLFFQLKRKAPSPVSIYDSETTAFFDPDRRDQGATMSRRQAFWLATMLTRERPVKISVSATLDAYGEKIFERIYDAIDQSSDIGDRLREEMLDRCVPTDELIWIKTDPEQLSWLNEAFLKRPNRIVQVGQITPLTLEPKDKFILDIDLWKADKQSKRSFLEKLREEWNAKNQHFRMLRWFDEAEYEKCDLLWTWLYKNKTSLLGSRKPFKFRAQVQEFFQEKDLRPDEIKHIVNTIKLRWSQRKYREKSNDKKQFNFFLSIEANRILDKITKTRGLSRSQMLEFLIHEESDRTKKKQKS